jgi:hypothetical protein
LPSSCSRPFAFFLQLSVEVLANHKFINAWLIVANLFVAYGLIRLWRARSALAVPARFIALSLVVIIVAGGVIDLMPVKNQFVIRVGMQGDRLFDWVRDETDRNAGLPDRPPCRAPHPPRRPAIYFGWPYYAWSAAMTSRNGRVGTATCSRTAVRATSSSGSRPRASTTSPSMTGCASGALPSA